MLKLSAIGHFERNPSLLDEIEGLAKAEQEIDVLVNHDQAHARLSHGMNASGEFDADARGEPESWLVKHEQPRAPHQADADGSHLPFAAAQRIAAL